MNRQRFTSPSLLNADLVLCLLLSVSLTRAEHCARFAEREDGEITYDPDDEVGLRLGSIATLQCYNGNIRRSRCTASGWKPASFNRCQPVVRDEPSNSLVPFNAAPPYQSASSAGGCAALANLNNGFAVYAPLGLAPFKPDTVATLVCNLGFVPAGPTSAKCMSNGQWSDIGSCEPATTQQCLPIGEIPNGQVSHTAGSKGRFGPDSVAELSCKLGFVAVGNNRVKCGLSGWEPAPGIGQCIEDESDRPKRQLGIGGAGGQCPALTPINGQIGYLQANPNVPYSSGTTAILTCNPGFSPVGAPSTYCSGSIWSPTLGTCQPSGMGGVPTATGNGILGFGGGVGGGTCPAMAAPLNGQIMYSMGGTLGPFPNGATATLTCNPGFSPGVGVTTASCQNGVWNPPTLGQCNSGGGLGGPGFGGFGGLGCPAALTPANGQLQYSSGGQGLGNYAEASTVTLICNAGFTISGSATSSCRSGQWYPPLGMCVGQGQNPLGGLGTTASVCPLGIAPPAGGGTVQYSNGNSVGPWQQETVATLICPLGTTSVGQTTSTCRFGQWTPPTFQPCTNNAGGPGIGGGLGGGGLGDPNGQCIVGLAVIGGTINYSNGRTVAPFPSGTTGTLQCTNGGAVQGPSSASCQNGQWNPPNLGPCGPPGR